MTETYDGAVGDTQYLEAFDKLMSSRNFAKSTNPVFGTVPVLSEMANRYVVSAMIGACEQMPFISPKEMNGYLTEFDPYYRKMYRICKHQMMADAADELISASDKPAEIIAGIVKMVEKAKSSGEDWYIPLESFAKGKRPDVHDEDEDEVIYTEHSRDGTSKDRTLYNISKDTYWYKTANAKSLDSLNQGLHDFANNVLNRYSGDNFDLLVNQSKISSSFQSKVAKVLSKYCAAVLARGYKPAYSYNGEEDRIDDISWSPSKAMALLAVVALNYAPRKIPVKNEKTGEVIGGKLVQKTNQGAWRQLMKLWGAMFSGDRPVCSMRELHENGWDTLENHWVDRGFNVPGTDIPIGPELDDRGKEILVSGLRALAKMESDGSLMKRKDTLVRWRDACMGTGERFRGGAWSFPDPVDKDGSPIMAARFSRITQQASYLDDLILNATNEYPKEVDIVGTQDDSGVEDEKPVQAIEDDF